MDTTYRWILCTDRHYIQMDYTHLLGINGGIFGALGDVFIFIGSNLMLADST